MDTKRLQALLTVFLAAISCSTRYAAAQPICKVEWSISNSYTVASASTSYVTLNLYASNTGTEDLVAPYNLTIYNPSYVDAFSWGFQVTGSSGGTIVGETQQANAFWETLLADSKNVANMGGNVETTELGAPPLKITIGGYQCSLTERLEGSRNGTPGSGGGSGGSTGGSNGGSTGGSTGGSSGNGTKGGPAPAPSAGVPPAGTPGTPGTPGSAGARGGAGANGGG